MVYIKQLWDTRVTKAACKDKCTEFTSSIEGIMLGKDPHDLLAISDDQLACFSMKKSAKISLRSMSDNVEDEFVSFCYMKNQRKVVCGSNTGNICLFSYGHWGDINDRLTVGAHSLDSILPYNDDVLLVGGDDKSIRVATLLPNEVKGKMKCIGKMDIDVLSTDSLCLNMDSSVLGRYTATESYDLAFIANYEYICIVPTDEVERLLDGDTEESSFFDDLE
uniref:Uncharacterized protein n=1 Tax=Babesia bovis TaxID=5865 RepID=A7AQ32_BABBO|eukprot:XP_001612234.1 hypothetical protein [Babesia bovis T2Bo]